METGYLLAFTTGLLGGFGHCIGMCGPIVASYAFAIHPAAARPISATITPHLLYNAGRITTYAFIGGLMGLTGSFLNIAGKLAGIQNIIAMIAGFLMIFMGMNITGIRGSTKWIEKHNLTVLGAAGRILSSASPLRFILLGLVLGLLPCGLSYTIFIAAAGSGGPYSGMMTALLFGLGTLPALIVFGTIVTSLGSVLRGRIYRAAGALVMIMGICFLIRGIRSYAGL